MEITLQIPEKLGFLLPRREVLSREFLEAYAAYAYRNEKLNLEMAFTRLNATNCRIDRSYLEEALKRARSRPGTLEP